MDLPGRTNELIQRIAEVNRKTVVVTQSVRATESTGSFLLRSVNIA